MLIILFNIYILLTHTHKFSMKSFLEGIKLYIISSRKHHQIAKLSTDFYAINRGQVRTLYRIIYKQIGQLYDLKLNKRERQKHLREVFECYEGERRIKQIIMLKITGQLVIQRIENGEYPPFPSYYFHLYKYFA